MNACPCGSGLAYAECCEPFIKGEKKAPTAEALMRSRYTAFTTGNVDHILSTIHPDKKDLHQEKTIRNWSQKSEWLGFEILDVQKGGAEDTEGKVEFIAHFRGKGGKERHHELAEFKKENDEWFFYDGEAPQTQQYVRPAPKVGRNDPCPCGSGKKYKKCCG